MKAKTHPKQYLFYGVASFLAGSLLLSAFSALQKTWLGVPVGVWQGYTIPVLLGGVTGVFIGLWYTKLNLYTQQVRQNEERFRTMADYTYDWEYWIDPQGQYIYITPACKRLTGYSADEFKQAPNLSIEIIHPEDRARVLQHFQEELSSNNIFSLEFRIITRNGETRWIGHKCQPVYNANRRHLGRRGSNRDITRWVKAKNAIKEREQTLRGIIDEALDGIVLANEQGLVTEWNKSQEIISGLKQEETVARPLWDVQFQMLTPRQQTPARYEKIKGKLELFFKSGKMPWAESFREITVYQNDGGKQVFQQKIFPIKTEKGYMLGSITRDITDRALAEEAGREQRLLAETLQEVTLALTAHVDLQSVLDEILNQLHRLTPYSTANVTLLHDKVLRVAHWWGYEAFNAAEMVDRLVQPLDVLPIDAEAIRTRTPILIPDTHKEPRWVTYPETKWIRSHITLPLYHQERVLGVLRLDGDAPNKFTHEDITRLEPLANAASIALENARLYEQALRDADTKAALLKEVNHRVKNNLSAIIGLLYAERRHAKRQNLPAYQAVTQELITRIQGLATAHTLLSDSEWQPIPLSYLVTQLIRTTLQSVSRSKQIIINISPSPLQVTPQQANSLALVITELATLYIKYVMAEQESVQLTASITDLGAQIQLKFQGISPKCFSAMMQAERDNVGLYLIRNIVKSELHGIIEVDRNTGSTIIVSFRNELGDLNDTKS